MDQKTSTELTLTHVALTRIRMLARNILAGHVGIDEGLRQIEILADAFHEVPKAIATQERLDPIAFRDVAGRVGIGVPDNYPPL